MPTRFAATLLALTCSSFAAAQTPWPSWRGPSGNGVATSGEYPIAWDESKHIAWKIDLPGRGASTPILIDDQLVFTLGVDDQNAVWSVGLDGKQKWTRTLGKAKAGKHAKASGANSSVVTDGNLLLAYFKSGDTGCFDKSGKLLWSLNIQEKYGEDTLWWDLGSSPIATENAFIITIMHSGPSYLIALDKQTGAELWKADRWLNVNQEANQSYTTPTVAGNQILTVGADHVTSHRVSDGALLWKLGGFNPKNDGYFRSIASPVVAGDLVICPYARGNTLTAVKLDESSSDKDRIAWSRDLGSDVPTPAFRDGKLYLLGDKGLVTCIAADSGKTLWDSQLPKSNKAFSSSPVLAGNRLYCLREDATCFVLSIEGDKPELVSQNKLDGQAVATPVFADNRIYLRTAEALYCIE
ncbi:PQQ-binding-like beta-propeller repeat protein [Pirellulaceae bacterium SH467]|jgi:outer membrane protein assembly factor BamB